MNTIDKRIKALDNDVRRDLESYAGITSETKVKRAIGKYRTVATLTALDGENEIYTTTAGEQVFVDFGSSEPRIVWLEDRNWEPLAEIQDVTIFA